ncbi:MAG: hypothetical protein QG673_2336 [Pseudomonadota bacterium]|nr:hypothetical protein [Pseudomonadota bacterium]
MFTTSTVTTATIGVSRSHFFDRVQNRNCLSVINTLHPKDAINLLIDHIRIELDNLRPEEKDKFIQTIKIIIFTKEDIDISIISNKNLAHGVNYDYLYQQVEEENEKPYKKLYSKNNISREDFTKVIHWLSARLSDPSTINPIILINSICNNHDSLSDEISSCLDCLDSLNPALPSIHSIQLEQLKKLDVTHNSKAIALHKVTQFMSIISLAQRQAIIVIIDKLNSIRADNKLKPSEADKKQSESLKSLETKLKEIIGSGELTSKYDSTEIIKALYIITTNRNSNSNWRKYKSTRSWMCIKIRFSAQDYNQSVIKVIIIDTLMSFNQLSKTNQNILDLIKYSLLLEKIPAQDFLTSNIYLYFHKSESLFRSQIKQLINESNIELAATSTSTIFDIVRKFIEIYKTKIEIPPNQPQKYNDYKIKISNIKNFISFAISTVYNRALEHKNDTSTNPIITILAKNLSSFVLVELMHIGFEFSQIINSVFAQCDQELYTSQIATIKKSLSEIDLSNQDENTKKNFIRQTWNLISLHKGRFAKEALETIIKNMQFFQSRNIISELLRKLDRLRSNPDTFQKSKWRKITNVLNTVNFSNDTMDGLNTSTLLTLLKHLLYINPNNALTAIPTADILKKISDNNVLSNYITTNSGNLEIFMQVLSTLVDYSIEEIHNNVIDALSKINPLNIQTSGCLSSYTETLQRLIKLDNQKLGDKIAKSIKVIELNNKNITLIQQNHINAIFYTFATTLSMRDNFLQIIDDTCSKIFSSANTVKMPLLKIITKLIEGEGNDIVDDSYFLKLTQNIIKINLANFSNMEEQTILLKIILQLINPSIQLYAAKDNKTTGISYVFKALHHGNSNPSLSSIKALLLNNLLNMNLAAATYVNNFDIVKQIILTLATSDIENTTKIIHNCITQPINPTHTNNGIFVINTLTHNNHSAITACIKNIKINDITDIASRNTIINSLSYLVNHNTDSSDIHNLFVNVIDAINFTQINDQSVQQNIAQSTCLIINSNLTEPQNRMLNIISRVIDDLNNLPQQLKDIYANVIYNLTLSKKNLSTLTLQDNPIHQLLIKNLAWINLIHHVKLGKENLILCAIYNYSNHADMEINIKKQILSYGLKIIANMSIKFTSTNTQNILLKIIQYTLSLTKDVNQLDYIVQILKNNLNQFNFTDNQYSLIEDESINLIAEIAKQRIEKISLQIAKNIFTIDFATIANPNIAQKIISICSELITQPNLYFTNDSYIAKMKVYAGEKIIKINFNLIRTEILKSSLVQIINELIKNGNITTILMIIKQIANQPSHFDTVVIVRIINKLIECMNMVNYLSNDIDEFIRNIVEFNFAEITDKEVRLLICKLIHAIVAKPYVNNDTQITLLAKFLRDSLSKWIMEQQSYLELISVFSNSKQDKFTIIANILAQHIQFATDFVKLEDNLTIFINGTEYDLYDVLGRYGSYGLIHDKNRVLLAVYLDSNLEMNRTLISSKLKAAKEIFNNLIFGVDKQTNLIFEDAENLQTKLRIYSINDRQFHLEPINKNSEFFDMFPVKIQNLTKPLDLTQYKSEKLFNFILNTLLNPNSIANQEYKVVAYESGKKVPYNKIALDIPGRKVHFYVNNEGKPPTIKSLEDIGYNNNRNPTIDDVSRFLNNQDNKKIVTKHLYTIEMEKTLDDYRIAIEYVIKTSGGYFSFFSDEGKDNMKKMQLMETLLKTDVLTYYPDTLHNFWIILSKTEKQHLTYIFGKIAKKGSLGFHNNPQNVANCIFGRLFELCIDHMEKDYGKSNSIDQLKRSLSNGTCIDLVSNDFASSHNISANLIWGKKT